MPQTPLNVDKSLPAAILAWLIPGAGHYYLGYRRLAATFFLAISVPFLAGLLMGGIKTCIDPKGNSWLFAAEICVGGYTLAGVGVSSMMGVIPEEKLTQYYSFYPTSEVAQIYLSVAGLLNILAILDVLMRAQTGGLPVFYHETMGTAVREEGTG